ncbi:hypothetical protein FSP39_014196 [Pinctada imbricata]|uniref:Uncharacterized protein n=1 Tax=Pinctada imbricata TaxID=66713 RepID=A0AA88YKL0_PINIB|nr:hypothetical protein FSP39_014196 [Pinctada imbricata]
MKLLILIVNKIICEHKTTPISCPGGQVIQVRSVNFGRTSSIICNNDPNINCYSSGKVTGYVAQTCNNKAACQLSAEASVLGDNPCPTIPKYLDIQYDCVIVTTTTTTTMATTTAKKQQQPQQNTHSQIASPNANGPQVCHEYLVSGKNGVDNSKMTATSTWTNATANMDHAPYRARLYNPAQRLQNGTYVSGGWSSKDNDKHQYIQAQLKSFSTIRGVITQGRNVNPQDGCCKEKVTKYKVSYSVDGTTYKTVKDGNGNDIVYIGNTKDEETPVTNMFGCPIIAKFVRILPMEWTAHISLRFDLIGCQVTTDPYGKCPTGWIERPGSKQCYQISTKDKKGFRQARQACKLQQGDLVKIETVQERDWLIQELQRIQTSKLQSGIYQVWIGLSNLPHKDNKDYKWVADGSSFSANVIPWKKGNPDNYAGQEHCGEFANGELNDANCDLKLNYICKKPKFWNNPGAPSTQSPPTKATMTSGSSSSTGSNTGNNNPQTKSTVTFFSPTKPTTRAPTTAGCGNQNDCYNLGIGDHQYCQDCHKYLTCAPSGIFARPCPANLEFDNNLQACVARSFTCRRAIG